METMVTSWPWKFIVLKAKTNKYLETFMTEADKKIHKKSDEISEH
jgi:hypothetical protein